MDAIHKTTADLEDWLTDFNVPEPRLAVLINPQYVEKDYLGDDDLLPKADRYWEIGVHARDQADLKRHGDSTIRFDTNLNYYDHDPDGFWQLYGEVVKELEYEFPDAELFYTTLD